MSKPGVRLFKLTRSCYFETPSNPLKDNIAALSTVAKQANVWLVVDNCFCTPILQNPGTRADIDSLGDQVLDGQARVSVPCWESRGIDGKRYFWFPTHSRPHIECL